MKKRHSYSYYIIKYYYETGIYSIKKMIEKVDSNEITKNEFHFITSYNYNGLKESIK